MSFYDITIQNKIWEKQIGPNVKVGFDFAGREIHLSEFDNHSSNYGWTLIDFGDDEYLVVNVLSKQEFPKNIEKQQNKEFIVNGNIFSISKNEDNGWDINLIEYKNSETATFNLDIAEENTNENKLALNPQEKLEEERSIGKDQTNMNDLEIKNILKNQEKEIELLAEELKREKEKTQFLQIENNEKLLNKLKKEIMQTKEISNTGNLCLKNTKTCEIKNIDNTCDSSTYIMDDLSKKMKEQTIQLENLKLNEKLNKLRLEDIEKLKNYPNETYLKQWEMQFGNATLALDFAGKIIHKDKFNQDVEGGWNIDYYNKDLASSFYISSIKSIIARDGKQEFDIDNYSYIIDNDGKQWSIKKMIKDENESIPRNFIKIAKNIQPNEYKEFNGEYNTFSSLLINLEHFPLQQLNKFHDFLKKSLENLPYFKDIYMYSNERVYDENESNITAYARVFFKSESIKDDIEILLLAVSLKKAMKKFMLNFKFSSRNDLLSFSIFLYNHGKTLKFIHAQTNFELLKMYPIPLRLPQESLVVDGEINSILKFHENNLWKKLRPYATDNNITSYYICDIDLEDINSPLFKVCNF